MNLSTIIMQELSENEKIVLEVVEDYLNKNISFKIKNVLPFINSRFNLATININDNGIKEILKSLVKKKYIFEDSKLSKNMILENKTRKALYDFILENPGTYFNVLLKHFKIHNKRILWHLIMLKKFDFIKREIYDNRYIYFDSQMEFEQVKPLYFPSKEKSKQIITYLQHNNTGVTKTKIATDLNMHFNTIIKYLKVLELLNLVKAVKIDNKKLYFLI